MRNFIDEGLEYKRQSIAARRPQRSGGNTQRHQRNTQLQMGYEFRRELVGVHVRARRSLAVLAERDEMIAEGLQLSSGVETRLEEMKAGRTIEIVLHVVLPIPQQLDRRTRLFGYPC